MVLRECRRTCISALSVGALAKTALASWTVTIYLAQMCEVRRGSCMLKLMTEKAAAESTTSAAPRAVSAQLPESDWTGHRRIAFVAHTRRPTSPSLRLSFVPALPLVTLLPAAHSGAVYPAAGLPSAPIWPPVNGCLGFGRPAVAVRHKMSSVRLGLASTVHPVLESDSLHSCLLVPSTPPAVAPFSLGTPHAASLFAVLCAQAYQRRCTRRPSQL